MSRKIILVTGASRGFGRLTTNALAHSGHTVYASMRGIAGRSAASAKDALAYADEQGVDLRVIELDVTSDASVDLAVDRIIETHSRLDVVVHNAGHRAFGPAEAFTLAQLAKFYDVNVLSTQRVNRAALPHMRRQRQGLLVWVSSSSAAGGTLAIWRRTWRPRPRWTRSLPTTRANCRWASRRRSSYPAPLRAAPTSALTGSGPPMLRAPPTTKRVPMPDSRG